MHLEPFVRKKPQSESYCPHQGYEELFVTVKIGFFSLMGREKVWIILGNPTSKMAFLWTEDKGISYIWSRFPCLTLICLKLRGKPLGKTHWPRQWQKSFQFILIPPHGSALSWLDRTSGPRLWVLSPELKTNQSGVPKECHFLLACEPQHWLLSPIFREDLRRNI